MRMTGDRPRSRLALIAFACGALTLGAGSTAPAQDIKPAETPTDAWAQIVPREAQDTDQTTDPAVAATAATSTMPAEPDWSELGKIPEAPNKILRAAGPRAKQPDSSAWSRNSNGNGTSAVAVKRDVSAFLDTHVGANLNLAKTPAATLADSLSDKMLSGDTPKSSSGTAWASMTGPGVPRLWDKTAVDISMDSGTDQGKVGTTLSRSVPLVDNAYSVTLQNAYRLTQPATAPLTGSQENRTLEIERSAKFNVNQTGTSMIASQTLSSADDKWLGKVGAEQKFLGDVTVTGTVNEATHGPVKKALTTGFKKSW